MKKRKQEGMWNLIITGGVWTVAETFYRKNPNYGMQLL